MCIWLVLCAILGKVRLKILQKSVNLIKRPDHRWVIAFNGSVALRPYGLVALGLTSELPNPHKATCHVHV